MRTAAKIFTVLEMIGVILLLLFFAAIQSMVKEMLQQQFDNGELIINGQAATQRDYDLVLQSIPVIFGFLTFIFIVIIIFKAINLFVLIKGYRTGILVFGIICLVSGSIITGIIQIVDFVLSSEQNNNPNASVNF